MTKIKLVVFDLDGTLIDGYTFNTVFRATGKEEKFEPIVESWLNRNLSSKEFLDEAIKLCSGLSERKVIDAIKKLKLMKGGKKLMSFLKKEGIMSLIITGTIHYAPILVAEKLGVDYLAINEYEIMDGVFTGKIKEWMVRSSKDKVKAMKKYCKEIGCSLKETMAVGDSIWEKELFEHAGVSVVINAEDEEIKKFADYVIEGKDLSKVIDVIKKVGRA